MSALFPSFTVFSVKYRLSPPDQTFPLPIHDSFVAFDKIQSIIASQTEYPPQISLLGSEIGGSLATSLALTKPDLIHSVVVSEPVFNWVDFENDVDEDSSDLDHALRLSTTSSVRVSGGADVSSLLNLRSQIFPKPETYFDPFASPMLFLRAPGKDCPLPNGKPEYYGPYDDDISSDSASSSSSGASFESDLKPVKRRRVLRRWPEVGVGDDVRLPPFHVISSDDSRGPGFVLRDQAEDMVTLMRRACFYGVGDEVAEWTVSMEVVHRGEGTRGGKGILGLKEAAKWLHESNSDDLGGTK